MTLARSPRLCAVSVLALVSIVVSACGEDIELGRALPSPKAPPSLTPADGGTSDAEDPNPCEGKVCGETCTPGGIVIHTEFHCDAQGACVSGASTCDGG